MKTTKTLVCVTWIITVRTAEGYDDWRMDGVSAKLVREWAERQPECLEVIRVTVAQD